MFTVAMVFRNSFLINGILTNLESSYGLTLDQIEQLERCDEQLIRTVLECPFSTPKEMLYLEMGVTPIRFSIMARRLMFHQYILKEDDDSLIRKFYKIQSRKSVKNDWSKTVMQNLETLKISLNENEIQNLSILSYQNIVKKAVKNLAFNHLIDLKNSHSKVMHIAYPELKMQDYVLKSTYAVEVAKFAFQCRARMVNVGANYKEGGRIKFPTCPVCLNPTEYDSQQHLLVCKSLNINIITNKNSSSYDDLFGKNLENRMLVVNMLRKIIKKETS